MAFIKAIVKILSTIGIIIFFLIVSVYIFNYGCRNTDPAFEQKLNEAIDEASINDIESLDLRAVFGSDWEKVCLQYELQHKDGFERVVGKKVKRFWFAHEGDFVFWVFYRDGTARQALVDSRNFWSNKFKNSVHCVTIDNPYMHSYYYKKGGYRIFYFK